MPKVLSDRQISKFNSQGFISGVDVFPSSSCDSFRQRIEQFEREHPEDASWALEIKCNLLFDWVYEISIFPLLLDIIEDLIGPDILLTNSIFRIKEPNSTTHYGWHQDAARIPVEPRFIIAYLAIGDATSDNGCLRVIPGSHTSIEPFHLVDYGERQVARVTQVDESRAVDLALGKGQVGLFSCNTIHGSNPNQSTSRRFALINDYTPATAKQVVGMGSGQVVRGSNSAQRWANEPKPDGSFTEANIVLRRNILTTYPENVLMGPLAEGASPSFADRPPSHSLSLRKT